MVFLPILYFYARKSIFYLLNLPKTPHFPLRRGSKSLFTLLSGGLFRPVAQKFRRMAKFLILFPILSKNGNLYAENVLFFDFLPIFLRKISKNR